MLSIGMILILAKGPRKEKKGKEEGCFFANDCGGGGGGEEAIQKKSMS